MVLRGWSGPGCGLGKDSMPRCKVSGRIASSRKYGPGWSGSGISRFAKRMNRDIWLLDPGDYFTLNMKYRKLCSVGYYLFFVCLTVGCSIEVLLGFWCQSARARFCLFLVI